MASKRRITINLNDVEYETLVRLAANTDRSLAWLGRKAICHLIEECERTGIYLTPGHLTEKKPTRRSAE